MICVSVVLPELPPSEDSSSLEPELDCESESEEARWITFVALAFAAELAVLVIFAFALVPVVLAFATAFEVVPVVLIV